MMDQSERIFGLKVHTREAMSATLEKQRRLNEQIKPQSLKAALEPLSQQTGVDFFNLYVKDYNVEPAVGEKKEQVRNTVSDISDLAPYFVDNEGRRYYRYIEHRFRPEKKPKECRDYIIIEENTPSGRVLAVFDYPEGAKPIQLQVGLGRKEINSLRLRGCYAIKPTNANRENDQAIDLVGFWLEQNPQPRKREGLGQRISQVWASRVQGEQTLPEIESMKVNLIALLAKDQTLTPSEQLNILKEKGYLFFRDSDSKTKWLNYVLSAAAFSQDEGDKTKSIDRSEAMLGVIRSLLGELYDHEKIQVGISQVGARAISGEDSIPQALEETRDWVRNRMASALYIVLYMHKLGYDLMPVSEYSNLVKMVEQMLANKEEANELFRKRGVKLTSFLSQTEVPNSL